MIPKLWPLCIGFGLWAVAFIGLYALQYLGCHVGWDPALHRTALLLAYAAFLAIISATLAFQIARLRKNGTATPPLDRMGAGATIAALAATAITFAPTLIASACL